ncbi:MAG: hypothetical protein E7365_03610 [Clostridiales bacterium]|nr:hypothetical protein [Clostridiales bacterium]
MTVYIEIVFIENFIIDYYLLLGASKITYIPCKHAIGGAIFGALYACIMPLFYSVAPVVQRLLVLLCMCVITFKTKNIKTLIFTSVAVLCASACLYGIVNLLFGHFIDGIFYTDNVFFIIALCSSFASVLIYRMLILLINEKKLKNAYCQLKINEILLNAFIDSGNSLYYKSTPVVLVNKNVFKDCELPIKPVIIPYCSIENSGALLGFTPKSVSLIYSDKTVELNCVIALCDHKFNKKYDALLHPDLVRECV